MTDAAPPRHVPSLSDGPPDDAAELLAAMWRIRLFEDEVKGLFSLNLIRGSTHLCQGQEATAVGVCTALSHGDTMTCTYRGHGAVLAMGAALDRCFGEILGRVGGLCAGRGGSMHLTDVSVGAIGSNAIVGAHLPITVGAALSAQHLGTGAVSVAFLGDGATNIGAFHESLNLAAVWSLPAIFVIENNQYGEYSPLAATTPITRLADRAASYGMPGVLVDGNDVVSMRVVTTDAIDRARAGDGPTLIEANTYRQQGHSRSDPATYRPEGELEHWLNHDPIVLLEDAMRAGAGAEEAAGVDREIDQIRADAAAQVAQARDRAVSWPEPAIEERLKDVYV